MWGTNSHWPYEDPPNLAVFTTACVMRRNNPIHLVTHDEDGSWQFHCIHGGQPHLDEAMIVALEEIVQFDPSVILTAGLPRGWRAYRETPKSEWVWEPRPRDEEHPEEEEPAG